MITRINSNSLEFKRRFGLLAIFLFGYFFNSGLGFSLNRGADKGFEVTSLENGRPELTGGETTVFDQSHKAYSFAAENLTESNLAKFDAGDSIFNQKWVAAPTADKDKDGLGPLFNASSCFDCHFEDGRGRPPLPKEKPMGFLFRLGHANPQASQGVVSDPVYGVQLQTFAIPYSHAEGKIKITYQDITDQYLDGDPIVLKSPIYEVSYPRYGRIPTDLKISPRVATALPGMGLLEAISIEDILSRSDPEDKDGDGISGRPNYISYPNNKKNDLGRFGWKAGESSIRQQVAMAFNQDMGLTTSILPNQNATYLQQVKLNHLPSGGHPEVSDEALDKVVFYSQTLAVPAARNRDSPIVIQGEKLFKKARCDACHTPTFKTGIHPEIPELSHQIIHPFTDLLLHDMGEKLSDHLPENLARGSEWRTAPLWGIGLVEIVNKHSRFMHDGRARNIEEAILWHGGEAENSKEYYKGLSKEERKAVITFVKAL